MDCLDFVQGLHSFVACFCGARFLRWSCVYFLWLWFQNAGNGILETHILIFSQGSMPPDLPRGSHLQRSWARLCWAKNHLLLVVRAGISETGILLKFNSKRNSAALWIIQLQTHQEHQSSVAPRVGHFLLFPAPHGGGFVAFCALLKLIPTYIPGWGGSGFTLTGALLTAEIFVFCGWWFSISLT